MTPEQIEEVKRMVGGVESRRLLRDIIARIAPVASERRQYNIAFRWSVVHDLTGHGSGYSRAICREIGLDPDEQVVWRERRGR